ncbi:hypothetical protein F9U64_01265 [Gracilibacillus oryzae]|uniref:Uncharacterized protein n=1 Tax=Gracilibacillus oryzae TaxID=1672701 RepID=A0A7C8L130_9BACI|nr:hypothetical protein [Gracilibacillus oryzae]KAB8139282.1 hypothetical protein F9U64_01265 [Gracilibacillus oryzae]
MENKQTQTLKTFEINSTKDQVIVVKDGKAAIFQPQTGHGTINVEFRGGRIKDFKPQTTYTHVDNEQLN